MAHRYAEALRVSRLALAQKDPQEMARWAGANRVAGGFTVSCLGEEYGISYPEGRVWGGSRGLPVTDSMAVLLLHYLIYATGAGWRGQALGFRQLPGGEICLDHFRSHVIARLLKLFGPDPGRMVRGAFALGGTCEREYRVTVPALPRVPVTLEIWPGDEETPAGGNVLYDASAPLYLPTEDLIGLAGITMVALHRAVS
ncbi:MAG TPA: hypothetical protein DCM14_05285 [Clostridiales bacterium UBA8153]|nr:hypothetical protein [Clostridiales bacterium UBA8153]